MSISKTSKFTTEHTENAEAQVIDTDERLWALPTVE